MNDGIQAWCALNVDEKQNFRNEYSFAITRRFSSSGKCASVLSQLAVDQAADNSQYDAHDIRNPVIDVSASVEDGLYEFNGTSECRGPNKDRQQTEAAGSSQGKGEGGEGDEMRYLVSPFRHWGRLVKGPEHRYGERKGYNERQGDVEVLAHL